MKYIDVEKFMQINIGDYDGIIVVKNTIPNNFLHYYIVFLPIELNNIPNNDIFNTKVYYEHILQTYNITSLNTFIRELNRKYWLRTNKLNYNGYQPEVFKTLPEFQPKDTNEFGDELRTSAGVKLVFKKPDNPIFSGTIYILTNGKTGSTCEPIVYAMKNSKKATIIGETTYGGMLAASPYVVSEKYKLMIPIADFYTYDGIRLDKVGVSPDITVNSDDALNKALEIINKSEN